MLSDRFAFVQRQLDDLRAVGIRTLTDERDALPHLVFDGALGDAFVRAPERRVVSCDPLLSQLVHTLSDCPPRLRETAVGAHASPDGEAMRAVFRPSAPFIPAARRA